jgi:GNAT superfamily N-acetyltransferase
MPSITTRPQTPADTPFLLEVYAGTRREELDAAGWPDATREAFVEMQFQAQQQGYRAAFPHAEWMVVHRGADAFRLVDMALLPAHRGCGIGKALIEKLLREAAVARKPVRLSVLKGLRAMHLYQRLGFKIIGEDSLRHEMEWK